MMIKIFIIAAQSVDGFIAKDDNHPVYWTSDAEKKRYMEVMKEADAVVMGSKAYEALHRPLQDKRIIVYSRDKHFEGTEATKENPHDLVSRLESEGVQTLAIAGGSQIFTMFLKAELVQKIYLSVEPLIFCGGLSLFSEVCNTHLELADTPRSESGSVLLEYNVYYHKIPTNK